MDKSFILSLGAGTNQLPLIETARNMGFEVIGVDQDIHAPGFQLCSIRIVESIFQYQRIWYKLHRSHIPGAIKAVVSRSFGRAQKSVAYLSEKLQLRGNAWQDFSAFLDKSALKEKLLHAGISTPPSLNLANQSKPKLPFPFLLKKKDGHGKQDIHFIPDVATWQTLPLEVKSSIQQYLIEPYLHPNREFTLIGFLHNKKLVPVEIFEKITTGPPYFIEIEHRAPVENLNRAEFTKLLTLAERSATALDLHYGPLIAEILFVNNQDFYMIEIIPEFGGELIAESLAMRRPAINIFREVLLSLTQTSYQSNQNFLRSRREALLIRFILWQQKSGESKKGRCYLHHFSFENLSSFPVVEARQLKPVGSELQPTRDNKSRLAFFILKGASIQKLIPLADELSDKCLIQSGRNRIKST